MYMQHAASIGRFTTLQRNRLKSIEAFVLLFTAPHASDLSAAQHALLHNM